MYIINVTPLKKGIFTDQLSYFSKIDIKAGTLVSVSIKNRAISALVLKSTDASKMKSKIRQSDFSLKKIDKILQVDFLSKEFIETGFNIADFYAKHPPLVFKSLIPASVLIETIKKEPEVIVKKNIKTTKAYGLQKTDEERLEFYKDIIKESFKQKESVFITLPTHLETDFMFKSITKDFPTQTFKLHTQLSSKKINSTWNEALAEKGPIIIVATPLFLSLPRNDINVYICDRENSRIYKQIISPFIDWRRFIWLLAKKKQATVIFGDEILRTETLHKIKTKELELLRPLEYSQPSHIKQKLIILKKEEGKAFQHLENEILDVINQNKKDGKKTLIITGRRGLHSTIVCNDCGQVVFCHKCHSPYVLHKKDGNNIFVCHKCHHEEKAFDKCGSCNGFRLASLGSGIETIVDEIKKETGVEPIILDKDKAKTRTEAKKRVALFLRTDGAVLIGTEMALYYLHEKVESVIMAGIDNLFTIPSFRTGERIISLIIRARKLATESFYLQTRNPAENTFKAIMSETLPDFFENELADRRDLRYPPFYTLIKITREGDEEVIKKDMSDMAEYFKDLTLNIYPAFTPIIKNKHRMHLIIRFKNEDWPDQKIIEKLKALPPQFMIDVEPEEIM